MTNQDKLNTLMAAAHRFNVSVEGWPAHANGALKTNPQMSEAEAAIAVRIVRRINSAVRNEIMRRSRQPWPK